MTINAEWIVPVITTTFGSFIVYIIKQFLSRWEKANKVRERKQENYYMKLDAVIFALAVASDNISGSVFQTAYNQKLSEMQKERNEIESVL